MFAVLQKPTHGFKFQRQKCWRQFTILESLTDINQRNQLGGRNVIFVATFFFICKMIGKPLDQRSHLYCVFKQLLFGRDHSVSQCAPGAKKSMFAFFAFASHVWQIFCHKKYFFRKNPFASLHDDDKRRMSLSSTKNQFQDLHVDDEQASVAASSMTSSSWPDVMEDEEEHEQHEKRHQHKKKKDLPSSALQFRVQKDDPDSLFQEGGNIQSWAVVCGNETQILQANLCSVPETAEPPTALDNLKLVQQRIWELYADQVANLGSERSVCSSSTNGLWTTVVEKKETRRLMDKTEYENSLQVLLQPVLELCHVDDYVLKGGNEAVYKQVVNWILRNIGRHRTVDLSVHTILFHVDGIAVVLNVENPAESGPFKGHFIPTLPRMGAVLLYRAKHCAAHIPNRDILQRIVGEYLRSVLDDDDVEEDAEEEEDDEDDVDDEQEEDDDDEQEEEEDDESFESTSTLDKSAASSPPSFLLVPIDSKNAPMTLYGYIRKFIKPPKRSVAATVISEDVVPEKKKKRSDTAQHIRNYAAQYRNHK